MGLPEMWEKTPEQIEGKHLKQLIGFAGSGQLRDDDNASREFRKFLLMIPRVRLEQYTLECLTAKFDGSGLALQDLVNEIGSRLGFNVAAGRYRGVSGQIGLDGLWRSPEGHSLVIEVKTTDAYRMSLDTVAGYRQTLLGRGDVTQDVSSILIVVGREDTGDLEAQIRGSRHAWDIRLISVDALLRLLKLKEETEEPGIHQKIRGILSPLEFTKVDGIIDFVFSAKSDIEEPEGQQNERERALDLAITQIEKQFGKGSSKSPDREVTEGPGPGPGHRPPAVSFHEASAARIQARLETPLVRRSRTLFASPNDGVRVTISVSRVYGPTSAPNYWFAFHPHQRERLTEVKKAYVAFGCGSEKTILLVPFLEFTEWLDGLWTTQRESDFYWHIVIYKEDDRLMLRRKKGFDRVDLTRYVL